ncbi:hypothetical protein SCANM124S_00091 [Streptomyces canus]
MWTWQRLSDSRAALRRGVYRLTMDDAMTAIAYPWRTPRTTGRPPTTDHDGDHADPFFHGIRLDLFERPRTARTHDWRH